MENGARVIVRIIVLAILCVALLLGGCLKFSTAGALCNVDADCGGDGLVCRERADFGDGRRRCWALAEDAGADAGAVADAGADAGIDAGAVADAGAGTDAGAGGGEDSGSGGGSGSDGGDAGADAGPDAGDAGADAGTGTGVSVRLFEIPQGTTHVTARLDSSSPYFRAERLPLATADGVTTTILADAGQNFSLLVTNLFVDGGTVHLLGTASASGFAIVQDGLTPVDLTVIPFTRLANDTPDAALKWQPFQFSERFSASDSTFFSSPAFRYKTASFSNSSGGLSYAYATASIVDAGIVRFQAATNLDQGNYYYQLGSYISYYVTPSSLGYSTYIYFPDTNLGAPLDTISISDASAAVINLSVTGVPDGSTALIAALDDGGTKRTKVSVPFDAGVGTLALELSPGEGYRIRVAAYATTGGQNRLLAAGVVNGISVDGGATPVQVAVAPIERVTRATPESVGGYAPFEIDETFATPYNTILSSSAYAYLSAAPFLNSDYPVSFESTYMSTAVVDAGITRWVSGSPRFAAPGTAYYQLRVGVVSDLEPGSSAYLYFPDTAAGVTLETIAVADAGAIVNLSVAPVPTAATHVVAALFTSAGSPRYGVVVPLDAGAFGIGAHPASDYSIMVGSFQVIGAFARMISFGLLENVTLVPGANSRSVTLAPPSRMTRKTPTCVDAGTEMVFDESLWTPAQLIGQSVSSMFAFSQTRFENWDSVSFIGVSPSLVGSPTPVGGEWISSPACCSSVIMSD